MKISVPEGFNPMTGKCPIVILLHGIFSSERYLETYGGSAELLKVEGENHFFIHD